MGDEEFCHCSLLTVRYPRAPILERKTARKDQEHRQANEFEEHNVQGQSGSASIKVGVSGLCAMKR